MPDCLVSLPAPGNLEDCPISADHLNLSPPIPHGLQGAGRTPKRLPEWILPQALDSLKPQWRGRPQLWTVHRLAPLRTSLTRGKARIPPSLKHLATALRLPPVTQNPQRWQLGLPPKGLFPLDAIAQLQDCLACGLIGQQSSHQSMQAAAPLQGCCSLLCSGARAAPGRRL